LRFRPSKNPKDDAGIWPQCGAAEIKTPFNFPAPEAGTARDSKSPQAKKNGRFWLTMLRGEAYIQRIGAPSANGAIARL